MINLKVYPAEWKLIPVKDKAAYTADWQKGGTSREKIQADLSKGRANGVGLITGQDLIQLDIDGAEAAIAAEQLGLPQTVAWTSGREGRSGHLFLLTPEQKQQVSGKTHKQIEVGESHLDVRYERVYCVLPPSAHPLTEGYTWLKGQSLGEIDLAVCPGWMIDQILLNDQPKEFPRQVVTLSGRSLPLTAVLAKDHRDLIDYGSGEGQRNQQGYKLANDLIGCENWLRASGVDYEGSAEALFQQYCDRCSPAISESERRQLWASATKNGATPCLALEKLTNCVTAWQKKQSDTRVAENKTSVTNDTARNPLEARVSEIQCQSVTTDREIKNFKDIQTSPVFSPADVLPPVLASKMVNDAALLNIDPVGIWQYLMAAVSSLMGSKTEIDARGGFRVPNIVWAVLLQHSGGGKSRAKNIVMAPLDRWQQLETEKFKEDYSAWKAAHASKKKEDIGTNIEQPTLKKFLFNVATPQALVKRLSEQEDNGCVLVRDELKGLFKSLDQFTGEGEGLDILLESWDGRGCAVDRVDIENSYYIPASRLSIGGGLQPGMFQRVFSDPDDSQGTLARFLLAVPQHVPAKRLIGHCELADFLPPMYQWVMNTDWGTLRLSQEADDEFTKIYDLLGNEKCPNEATRAWMAKLSGQVLRICMPIHALECYSDRTRDTGVIQKDTLLKAYRLALYYKSCFYSLQGFVSNDISGVLLKIYEKASSAGSPLEMGDFYRNIRAIRNLAKEEGVGIKDLTLSLCRDLESLGKGEITVIGKKHFFAAKGDTLTPDPQNSVPEGDVASATIATQLPPVSPLPEVDFVPTEGSVVKETTTGRTARVVSYDPSDGYLRVEGEEMAGSIHLSEVCLCEEELNE